ncbi:MAG TPA: hypothetical protein VFR81_20850 [Longimicrobium sp.]|nr:hypothetical protein [Longimicrobium sp.]
MPIDWVALAGVIMGTLIVLIPVAGLTARFALKPMVEALARWKEAQAEGSSSRLLEQRVALLEAQLGQVEGSLHRVLEEQEFNRKLGSGTPS